MQLKEVVKVMTSKFFAARVLILELFVLSYSIIKKLMYLK